MSDYLGIIKRRFDVSIKTLRADIASRRDRDFFRPTGTQVYCGKQGSGKTISAVKHTLDLKKIYPKAILVSNLDIKYYEPISYDDYKLTGIDTSSSYIRFDDMADLQRVLTGVNNGKYGVILLIDEIHTYFNALESKNIPMYVFTEISQQRKQRKLIIGTSQLFLRMAKPFREQCDNLIVCNTWLGLWTFQKAYDGMSLEQDYEGKLTGDLKRKGFFFHDPYIRNSFDTYQKVISGAEQYAEMQRMVVVDKKLRFIK